MEAIKAALIIQNPNPEREEKMTQVTQVEEKKQEKKIELRVGGGGIGGLLVLGGALAAVALWAALRNRSKRRPTNKIIKDPPNDPSEEQQFSKEGEGLCSILQTPSPSAENHQRIEEAPIIHSTAIGSCDSTEIKSDIMEKCSSQINGESEKPKLVNGEMDNSRSDLSGADDYGTTNTGILTGQEDDDQNKEDNKHVISVEIVASSRERIDKVEESPSLKLFNNKKEEDEEGESSDVTGDSSMESNAEAIWPAEMIERPSETEIKSCIENLVKTIANEAENNANVKQVTEWELDETYPVKMMEMQEIQSHQSSRVVVLVWSMVGVLLLFFISHLISKSYVPSISWSSNATQSL